MRDFFLQRNRDTALDFGRVKKCFGRPNNEVFAAFRNSRIIAMEIDRSILFLNHQLITKRNRRNESLDLVKTVGTAAQNSQ